MDTVFWIVCTHALIGGFTKEEGKLHAFESWQVKKECRAKYGEGSGVSLEVRCDDGELYVLPASSCSISQINKPKKKKPE